MKSKNKKPIAVDVFMESKKTRTHVGQLKYADEKRKKFIFTYNEAYLYDDRSITIGPEFPLTERSFTSEKIFPSFLDRIPSRQNSAYKDYCAQMGISIDEDDIFVLLTTIGRKGPSAFIFEPVYEDDFDYTNLIELRGDLKLSIREFGVVFDFSPYSIQKIESGKYSGKELLKRIEIYYKFPEVALYEIKKNRNKIHSNTYERLLLFYNSLIGNS